MGIKELLAVNQIKQATTCVADLPSSGRQRDGGKQTLAVSQDGFCALPGLHQINHRLSSFQLFAESRQQRHNPPAWILLVQLSHDKSCSSINNTSKHLSKMPRDGASVCFPPPRPGNLVTPIVLELHPHSLPAIECHSASSIKGWTESLPLWDTCTSLSDGRQTSSNSPLFSHQYAPWGITQ